MNENLTQKEELRDVEIVKNTVTSSNSNEKIKKIALGITHIVIAVIVTVIVAAISLYLFIDCRFDSYSSCHNWPGFIFFFPLIFLFAFMIWRAFFKNK